MVFNILRSVEHHETLFRLVKVGPHDSDLDSDYWYWAITCFEQFYTWFGSLNLCVVRRLPSFHSGWTITLAFTGVADLSEVMEHVSWTRSNTTLHCSTLTVPHLLRGLIVVVPWQGVDNCAFPTSGQVYPSMADILIEKYLRWLGHVRRMGNNWEPKQLLSCVILSTLFGNAVMEEGLDWGSRCC